MSTLMTIFAKNNQLTLYLSVFNYAAVTL